MFSIRQIAILLKSRSKSNSFMVLKKSKSKSFPIVTLSLLVINIQHQSLMGNTSKMFKSDQEKYQ